MAQQYVSVVMTQRIGLVKVLVHKDRAVSVEDIRQELNGKLWSMILVGGESILADSHLVLGSLNKYLSSYARMVQSKGRQPDDSVEVVSYDTLDTKTPSSCSVEHQVIRKILMVELFEYLSESERELFELAFVDSKSQAEIAQKLGISQSAVSQQLKKLRGKLRAKQRLEKRLFDIALE